jgi:6-phosphogluconolactonase
MTPSSGLNMRILEDQEALGHAAVDMFISLAETAMIAHNRFPVAFSGGSTPRGFYTLLGSSPYRNSVDWKRVHVFWVDERCVPRYHAESNFKLVFDTVLSKVPLASGNIHRVRGEEEPERAARSYEQELCSFFGPAIPVFDLIVLGAGADGHTASLFPGSATLQEKSRLAVPVYLEAPKISRVTLTLPVLNHAAQVLFLASGREKSGIVLEIMEEGNPRHYPAGLVMPVNGGLTWFIDREAAVKLRAPYRPQASDKKGFR